MALAFTNRKQFVTGNQRVVTGTLAFDSSYPTGGEACAPSVFGLNRITSIRVDNKSGYSFEYDYSGQKLLAYYADYDAVADGALIQVADTTNLSTLTGVRVRVEGN